MLIIRSVNNMVQEMHYILIVSTFYGLTKLYCKCLILLNIYLIYNLLKNKVLLLCDCCLLLCCEHDVLILKKSFLIIGLLLSSIFRGLRKIYCLKCKWCLYMARMLWCSLLCFFITFTVNHVKSLFPKA